jgi:hypothetical protein
LQRDEWTSQFVFDIYQNATMAVFSPNGLYVAAVYDHHVVILDVLNRFIYDLILNIIFHVNNFVSSISISFLLISPQGKMLIV